MKSLLRSSLLFPLLWLLLALCWLPAYLALFPGTFGYDSYVELMQYAGAFPLSNHHPVAHVFLLGWTLDLGHALFGSYNAGIALYTGLQGLLLTLAEALSLYYLFLKKVPFYLLIPGFLWAAFNPLLPILGFNTTKDILFGACFLLFQLAYGNALVETGGLPGKKDSVSENDAGIASAVSGRQNMKLPPLILLGISSFLLCLTRKQGIYVLLALLVITLLLHLRSLRRKRSFLLAMLIGGSAFFLLEKALLFGLQIPDGDPREALSLPIQQLAAVTNDHYRGIEENPIDPEDFALAEQLIPEEYLICYEEDTADPIKAGFQTEVFMKDPGKYISLYFRLFASSPRRFFEVFCNMNRPYFDLSANRFRGLMTENLTDEENRWEIGRQSLLPDYELFLEDYAEDSPTAQWTGSVIPIILTLLLILAGILTGNKAAFLMAMPCTLFFGTNLLGPVALVRYSYPLLLSVPLLFGLLGKSQLEFFKK